MIIEARDDRVSLSGSLQKNLWPSIQAVAHLLLRQNPDGILIDAAHITDCSAAGAKTFLDALEYIDRYHARIVLCAVPEAVMTVLRSVPGVRSQVPIAETCEAGRASLEVASMMRKSERRNPRGRDASKPSNILVPILPGLASVREALGLAEALGRLVVGPDRGVKTTEPEIHLAFITIVPRTLPLNAPMAQEEEDTRKLVEEAASLSEATHLQVKSEIARTRDAAEEIVSLATSLQAGKIVLVMPKERIPELIRTVLQNSPCEVVVKR